MRNWLIGPLMIIALAGLLASGCVEDNGTAGSGATGGSSTASRFTPTSEIPNIDPMLNWAKLRLGMGGVDISQVYNAPEGVGEGFTRVQQHFGSSINHIIAFVPEETGVKRAMTLALYRDKLFMIIDRREGMSAEQADEWYAEVAEMYEGEPLENIGGAQYIWGDEDNIMATFTRDNASDKYMTCTFVLEHIPTRDAWHGYNEQWEKDHPQD